MAAAAMQGVSLKGMHADHQIPHTKGGSNDITNCKIMKPNLNIMKSNKRHEPRRWQKEFQTVYFGENKKYFLCSALPAGGKTWAALSVANQWMQLGKNRQVIIVVPSVNLKYQWSAEAKEQFGLDIKAKEMQYMTKDEYDGYVSTYAALKGISGEALRWHCGQRETMLILDEPHHCSEENVWGISVKEQFGDVDNLKKVLMLTGTPFRSDGYSIPFVDYDANGFSRADFSYDYPQALADRVVRYIKFSFEMGRYASLDLRTGKVDQKVVDLNITVDEAKERLADILDVDHSYIKGVISLAHEKLMSIRGKIPNAAAMAMCYDINHAKGVARVIKKITGCTPSIVVSEQESETDTIDNFRKSKKEWIVSVKKISEGVSINRLQVLCYFTTYTTDLFVRQALGRVMRVARKDPQYDPKNTLHKEDSTCYVYFPSDPRLYLCAQNIENAQVHALKEIEEREERGEYGERSAKIKSHAVVSSEHTGTELIMINGKPYTPQEGDIIALMAEGGELTSAKAAELYDIALGRIEHRPVVPEDKEIVLTLDEEKDQLRRDIRKIVHRISLETGVEHKQIHYDTGFGPQNTLTKDELIAKLNTLNRTFDILTNG